MLIDPIHLKFGEKLKDKFFAHVIGKQNYRRYGDDA